MPQTVQLPLKNKLKNKLTVYDNVTQCQNRRHLQVIRVRGGRSDLKKYACYIYRMLRWIVTEWCDFVITVQVDTDKVQRCPTDVHLDVADNLILDRVHSSNSISPARHLHG